MQCFYGCKRCAVIPQGLFDHNTEASQFRYCFSNNYASTSGSNMNSWTTVPSDLFNNCPNVYSFEGCFRYCRKITSALPELWNTHPTARGTYCFLGCEAAENYADVPSGWK